MPVSIERNGGVAVVSVDNPPVNALSQAVRAGLHDAVERLDADPEVRAVVLLCKGRTFIAGTDVTEFGNPTAAVETEWSAKRSPCRVSCRLTLDAVVSNNYLFSYTLPPNADYE